MAELDKRIEGILLQRLSHIIKVWCAEFDRVDDGDSRRELPVRDALSKRRGEKRAKEEKVTFMHPDCYIISLIRVAQFLEGNMTLKPIVHEIRIQNQVIFLDPPIEFARSTWIHQLHDWLGMFTSKLLYCVIKPYLQASFVDYGVFKAHDTRLDCKCKVRHSSKRPTYHWLVDPLYQTN